MPEFGVSKKKKKDPAFVMFMVAYLIIATLQRGGRGWAAKEAPRVMGGTTEQLIQRLTHHKVIGMYFLMDAGVG